MRPHSGHLALCAPLLAWPFLRMRSLPHWRHWWTTVLESIGHLRADHPDRNNRLNTTPAWNDITNNGNGYVFSYVAEFNGNPNPSIVAAPAATPPAGTYDREVLVSLATSTSGAVIRYTTDGSAPVTSSPVYLSPVDLTTTTTIRAQAYKDGITPSDVATFAYVVRPAPQIVDVQLNSSPINNGANVTKSGNLSVTLNNSQSARRVEFYYRTGSGTDVLIGYDDTPADGFQVYWAIPPIPDGTYILTARVYDSTATPTETTRNVNVALAAPLAPAITYPYDGLLTDRNGHRIARSYPRNYVSL